MDLPQATITLPQYFKLQFSQAQIATEIARLGSEITPWAKQVQADTGQELLCLPILRGGIFFFADLVRTISSSVDMAAVRAKSYEIGLNGVPTSNVSISAEDLNPEGRGILLADDICDSGRTLEALKKNFMERGASSVRSAVLIKRQIAKPVFEPDFVGFNYKGDEWFVGYGMEDAERYRNLSAIYIIDKN